MRISIEPVRNKMTKKKVRKEKSKLKERLHWISGNIMAIIAVILIVAAFGGAYYFVIAPSLVSKPLIEKPSLPEDALERIGAGEGVINSSHINYVINEIGAYKLKKPFGTKDYPVMEFVLTGVNERYYSYVKDNMPVTKKGNAKDEDIIIKGSQGTVVEVLESANLLGEVREAKDDGRIKVELVSDMKILAAKRYLSIYDTLR